MTEIIFGSCKNNFMISAGVQVSSPVASHTCTFRTFMNKLYYEVHNDFGRLKQNYPFSSLCEDEVSDILKMSDTFICLCAAVVAYWILRSEHLRNKLLN